MGQPRQVTSSRQAGGFVQVENEIFKISSCSESAGCKY